MEKIQINAGSVVRLKSDSVAGINRYFTVKSIFDSNVTLVGFYTLTGDLQELQTQLCCLDLIQ
jgi:hypothetical protein